MPRKRGSKNAPNDFLDGEKLTDNAEIRTSLQPSSLTKPISPPRRTFTTTASTDAQPDHATPVQPKGKAKKGEGKGKGAKEKKPPLTHFLCLPLVNNTSRDRLRESLEKFTREVVDGEEIAVPRKAIRPLGTLHLTLGVMSLDDEALTSAIEYLSSLDLGALLNNQTPTSTDSATTPAETEPTPSSTPLTLSLTSLHPMQQPHKTSILYASPQDPSNRLLPFARSLKSAFEEKGLMAKEKRDLRLHATIINTIYAKQSGRGRRKGKPKTNPKQEPPERDAAAEVEEKEIDAEGEQQRDQKEEFPLETSQGHGPNARSFLKLDATHLISRYEDFVWAENVTIGSVAMCKMGAKKIVEGDVVVDERYEVVAERALP